jgi:Probable RNA ligase (RNA_lig_DRB0094).
MIKELLKKLWYKEVKIYENLDIWTTEGKKLEGLVPENYLVFAELIGWTAEGTAIQTDYTYNLPTGDCRLYVYRVAVLNHKGLTVDLSWDQLKEWCKQRNLNHVPELWRGKHKNFKASDWLDKKFHLEHPHAVAVDKQSIDEGICIRVEALTPQIYKAKSPKFFEYETAQLDKEVVDLESTAAETLN